MDSLGVQVGAWWPLAIPLVIAVLLAAVWFRRKGAIFPDLRLITRTSAGSGFLDLLPVWLGAVVVLLLIVALMSISATREVVVEKRARDFLVLVDTSRSMRENTSLLRADSPPSFERGAGLFSELVEDTSAIPELARYEVARESLLAFVRSRRAEDRVGLIFFNTQIYLMCGFTTNLDFVEQQLASMDDFVNYTTNIRGALQQGLDMIERYPSRNRQAVILLTDAEAKNTEDLQQQMNRLGKLEADFYLLWIAPYEGEVASDKAREILDRARAIGTVFTVEDVSAHHLDEAFAQIGRLENYTYLEPRTVHLDLSRYAFDAARWLMLLWIVLTATAFYPLRAGMGSGVRLEAAAPGKTR